MTKRTTRRYRRVHVALTDVERAGVAQLLRAGKAPVRTVLRARALLLLDGGRSVFYVQEATGLDHETARRIALRYHDGGVRRAIYDADRPGGKPLLSDKQGQVIVAMVCGQPPDGYARWTVRLIAEHAVKRGVVPTISRETVRVLLLNHDLKPWREKNVVRQRPRRRVHPQDGGRARGVRAAA